MYPIDLEINRPFSFSMGAKRRRWLKLILDATAETLIAAITVLELSHTGVAMQHISLSCSCLSVAKPSLFIFSNSFRSNRLSVIVLGVNDFNTERLRNCSITGSGWKANITLPTAVQWMGAPL